MSYHNIGPSCSICCEGFEQPDYVVMTWCKHVFHGGCIDKCDRCPECSTKFNKRRPFYEDVDMCYTRVQEEIDDLKEMGDYLTSDLKNKEDCNKKLQDKIERTEAEMRKLGTDNNSLKRKLENKTTTRRPRKNRRTT